MKKHHDESLIKKTFIPKYDEIDLSIAGIAVVLVFFLYPEFRSILAAYFDSLRGVLFLIICFFGMLLSFVNVLVTRKKSKTEKMLMLLFAVTVNGGTGLVAGWHMLNETTGILIIFPLWNLITAATLLFMFRFNLIKEDSISDEDANVMVAIPILIIGAAIVLVLKHYTEFHWSISLSIILAYSSSAGKIIRLKKDWFP